MSYNREEYGGGGSSGQNYYDQNADFSEQPRHGHGQGHHGGQQEHRGGEQEYRGGNDEYRGGGGRDGQQEYRGGNDEYRGGGGRGGEQEYRGGNDEYRGGGGRGGQGHHGGQQEHRGGEQEYRGGNDEYRGGGGHGGQQEYRGGNDEHRSGGGRGGQQEYRDTRYNGPDSYSGGDDFSSAAQHAQEHHGDSSHAGMFDKATSYLNERKGQIQQGDYEVDEQHAVQSHQAMYGGDSSEGQSHDSSTVGAGAAMQALKMFTGGSGSSSDGGFDKNKLIGMAMSQASQLWDQKQSGGASMSGDKQSAVNNAAEMAMKMYMKSGGGGIGGTGGASGLMSLAEKFF